MGLALGTLGFLLDAYARGVSFKDTLTIGRTQLYLSPADIRKVRRIIGHDLSKEAIETEFGGFGDEFLKSALAIETLQSLDYSDYQGASIVHDLNKPISPDLENRFDAVIDSGTLEHVFNFPIAIANYMKMVRRGGRLFIVTVANNHCGHGFYQFSPELFFRIFKARNGFHLERLLLLNHPFPGLELSSSHRFFSVQDPEDIQNRVGLVTGSPVILLLEAERRSTEQILVSPPEQSDYTNQWKATQDDKRKRIDHPLPHRFMEYSRTLFYAMPSLLQRYLRTLAHPIAGFYQRHILYSLRNQKYYRQIQPISFLKKSRQQR